MAEAQQPRPGRDWRRRIFGRQDSRRRMVWIGLGGGVALAIVAAFIASAFGGSSGNSLDNKPEPTSISSGGENPDDGGVIDEEPTEIPVFDTPTEAPIEQPTEEPIATEPEPTDVPVDEATPTEEPVEQPTDAPTVAGGA